MSDNSTSSQSNRSLLYNYTSSFLNYLYGTVFKPDEESQIQDKTPQRNVTHKSNVAPQSKVYDKAKPGKDTEKKISDLKIYTSDTPSVIDTLRANFEDAKAYTNYALEQISSLTNQVQETCDPYLQPVKRLGSITNQALHSEAAEKVKDVIQLKILNGLENTIRTTRLSYQIYKYGDNTLGVEEMKNANSKMKRHHPDEKNEDYYLTMRKRNAKRDIECGSTGKITNREV